MENNMYSLRGGFKKARTKKGITQAQVAKEMDVNLKTVMNWEQGISNPNLETTMKLCELFDCDLDFLAGRIKERTHDIKTACELTGLSEAAIEKLTSNRVPAQPGTKGYDIKTASELTGLSEEEIRKIVKPQRSNYASVLSKLIEAERFSGLIWSYKVFLDSVGKLKESALEQPDFSMNNIETVVLSREQATRYYMRSAADAMMFLCEDEFRKNYQIAMENEDRRIKEEAEKEVGIESRDE